MASFNEKLMGTLREGGNVITAMELLHESGLTSKGTSEILTAFVKGHGDKMDKAIDLLVEDMKLKTV